MNLFGITRSSNEDVARGYGSSIQEAELIAYCHSSNHNLVEALHITEPATIDSEDRMRFQTAIAKAKNLKQSGVENAPQKRPGGLPRYCHQGREVETFG